MTGQAVETALEAEQAMKQARSLALRKEDRGVQTEDSELKSPGARLQRRSGVGAVGGRAGQVTSATFKCTVQSLFRLGRREDMIDDSAEIFF